MRKTLAVLLSVLMVISTITCMFTVTTAQAEVTASELISNGDFEDTALNPVGTNMGAVSGTKDTSVFLNGKWYRATGGLKYATYGDLTAYDAETDTVTMATETEYAKYFTACSTVVAQPDDTTNHIGRFQQTLFQAVEIADGTYTFKFKIKGNEVKPTFYVGLMGLQNSATDGTIKVTDSFHTKYDMDIIEKSGNFTYDNNANGRVYITLTNPTEWTDIEFVATVSEIAEPTSSSASQTVVDTDFAMLQFYNDSVTLNSDSTTNGNKYRTTGMYVDDISLKAYANPFGEAEFYKDGTKIENTNEDADVVLKINGEETHYSALGDTVTTSLKYNEDANIFAGWYKNDELVTRDEEITFTVNSTDIYTPKFINKNLLEGTAASFENYENATSLAVTDNTKYPEVGEWGATKNGGYYGATYAETIYDVNGNAYTQVACGSTESINKNIAITDNTKSYTGQNSLRVVNKGYRPAVTALSVTPNTNYTLSYYVMGEDTDGTIYFKTGITTTVNVGRSSTPTAAEDNTNPLSGMAAQTLADLNAAFTLTKYINASLTADSWQKVTLSFNSGNFETLYFAIAPQNSENFYVDDLCLVAEEEAASVPVKFVDSDGVAIADEKAANIYAAATVTEDLDGSNLLDVDYENESGAYTFLGWYDTDGNLLSKEQNYDFDGDLANVYAKIVSRNILDGSASFEGYENGTSLQVTDNTKYPEENEWGLTKNAGYYGVTYEEVIYDKAGYAYQQTASGSAESIGSSKMLVSSDAAYRGTNSLRFTFSSRAMVSGLNVTPNTNYTLTYYALASAENDVLKYTGVATTVNISQSNTVTAIDEDAVFASSLKEAIGNLPVAVAMDREVSVALSTTEWTKITFTFNSGNFEKLYLCVCPNSTTSPVYIDELSLVAEEKAETIDVKVVNADGTDADANVAANAAVSATVEKDLYTGTKTLVANYDSGAYTFLGWYNADDELLSTDKEYVVTGSLDGIYAKVQNNNLLTDAASYEIYENGTDLKYAGTDYPSGIYFGGNANAGYLRATYDETIYDNEGKAIEQEAGGTATSNGLGSVTISNEKAHSGNSSVKLLNSFWTASMGIDVEPNTDYALSYWILAPKQVDKANTIMISAISTTLNTGTSSTVSGGTNTLNQATNLHLDSEDITLRHDGENWIKVTHSFNSMNLEKVYLVLGQTAYSGEGMVSSWAYIDDMTMIETTPTTLAIDMKSCASVEPVNASLDGLYVDQEFSFKVIDNMDTDAVVTFNGETVTANADGIYTVILTDKNALSVRFDGDEALPNYDEDEFGRKLNVNNLDVYTEAVWEGDTVYHETALFTPDKDTVKLLYPVDSIVSLRSYDLTQNYIEGYDFEITADGQIKRLEGGRIPVWANSLYTETEGDWQRTDGNYVVLTGDTTYPKYAISVTYKHSTTFADGYTPATPESQYADLNNVIKKLENGEEVNIVVYGDSISCGWSSSGMNPSIEIYDETNTEGSYITRYNINVAPYAPTWIQMLEAKLKQMYPDATINFKNLSLGGKNAKWGANNIEARLALWKDEEGNQIVPDLLLTGFGVNDANNYVNNSDTRTYEEELANFKAYMQAIVDNARTATGNSNMEVLMYSPMFPNQDAIYWPAELLLDYEASMVEIANADNNVGVLKLSSIFEEIVKNKAPEDYLNTNLNHGNDFTARLYLNGILAAMVKDENAFTGILGDANGDEVVNLKDLVTLARFVAEWEGIEESAAMDVNKDGIIDLADVNYLARHLAGWDDSPLE